MGFSEKDLLRKAVPLVGFSGETKHSMGEVVIPTFAGGVNKQVRYLVIDGSSTYNVILGRPWIHEMKAIPSTYHQSLKFPTPWGVQELRGHQEEARDCYKDALKPIASPPAELDELHLDAQNPDRTVLVGEDCTGSIRQQLLDFLRTNMDFFAWSHDDGSTTEEEKVAPERNEVINQEVDNLLVAGKIRKVKYPEWLSNVVVVPKKNNKWRVCVDFTDLNKACPKDPFPLPHVDAMVDATVGHKMLTFLDAWSGYNQIKMHPDD
ncbi:uncharacterized protein LOC141628304 [Silene latifolia]|uniref:uncharacterized protein LOC141628304 n=1 Tax=Silene latifolia TaxID=37657 RepID=UPI003D786DD0